MEERHTSLQNPCDLCDARFLVGVLWHKLFWHSLQSKTMTLQTVPAGAYLLSIERGSFTWRTGLPNQPCSFTKEYCRTPLAPNDRIHHPQFAFKERTVLIVNFLFQPQENPNNFYLVHRQHPKLSCTTLLRPPLVFLLPRHTSCITTFVDADFQIFRRLLIGILQLRSKDLRCDLVQRSVGLWSK